MLNLQLPTPASGTLSVLCLGAHCDDIEIGCGGTLLELTRARQVDLTWVIFSSDERRASEARKSAESFQQHAARAQLVVKSHRDGFLPYVGGQVKDDFELLKSQLRPDVIFTHFRDDLHQDHRLVCELTWNTFRDHFILEYEIPKYDGDLGVPNAFFALSEETARRKAAILRDSYASQASKRWFTEELFLSLLRLRGLEAGSGTGLAEAFYARKTNLCA